MHNNRETVIIPQTIIVTTKSIIVASLEMSFQVLLVRDSAFRIGMGRSFHQSRTVNENVLESDFEPLCDGTTRHRSLANLMLLEGM